MINLANDAKKIQKFDSATDSLALKKKNMMHIGTMMPPPPIPPALESAIRIPKMTDPKNSIISSGNTSLCSHFCSSMLHVSYGGLQSSFEVQSLSIPDGWQFTDTIAITANVVNRYNILFIVLLKFNSQQHY